MGTHPIFESDFDCLTGIMADSGEQIITNVEIGPKVARAKRGRKKKSDTAVSDSNTKIPKLAVNSQDNSEAQVLQDLKGHQNASIIDKPKKTEKTPKVSKPPNTEKIVKPPKGVLLESDITKVYEYVKSQNRPYSVADIFTNLRKEVGKTNLTRIMDQLEADGKVVSKTPSK